MSLSINGTDFPMDAMNILNFLHMSWGTRGLVPTCHLSVFDARHTLDKIPLQDGIPLVITIKAFNAQTQTFNFRKFHHHKENQGNGFVYEFDGYLDAPKYWLGTSVGGIQGTSNDTLSQIAATCGLQFDGSSTNDSQLWMPRNKTFAEFSRAISARGYADSTSYMELAVTPNSLMRYKDVNKLPAPTTDLHLGQDIDGSITCIDYKPRAKSGLTNKMTGYQNTRYAQSVSGQTASTPNENLTFKPDSKSPLFNSTVKDAAGRGYQSFGGLDVGNTHDYYEAALYQNLRYSNLLSQEVEFFINSQTTIQPLDTISFSVDQEASMVDRAFAGAYIISARAIFIQGANYAEKFLGVRHGTNLDYTNG